MKIKSILFLVAMCQSGLITSFIPEAGAGSKWLFGTSKKSSTPASSAPSSEVQLTCNKAAAATNPLDDAAVKSLDSLCDPLTPQEHFNLGVEAYKVLGISSNFNQAADHFRIAAEKGDPETKGKAMVYLGKLWDRPWIKGRPKGESSNANAVSWFEKAVSLGNKEARAELGGTLIVGKGGKKRRAEGLKLLQEEAEKKNAIAECNLGYAYSTGQFVKKNLGKARKYFEQAAKEGNALANFNLGSMYDKGDGVSRDPEKALTFFKKAADGGFPLAMFNVAVMLNKGDKKSGIERNPAEALKWLEKAKDRSELGDDLRETARRMCDRIRKETEAPKSSGK